MTIWTIEIGDRSFEDLERLLSDHAIPLILDARRDRHPLIGPDRESSSLDALAGRAGFGYRWMGNGEKGAGDATIAALAAMVAASDAALVCDGTGGGRCAALGEIASGLQRLGVRVLHLADDGSTVPHEPRLPLEP